MNRRTFSTTILFGLMSSKFSLSAEPKSRRILLRSSWQTVNIGDIGHTPGVLHLLEQHLRGVEVRLWPSNVDNGVKAMLHNRFPKVSFVQSAAEIKAAFAECDFLLHGSGPSLVAAKDVAKWKNETNKPYGVYGITCSATDQKTLDLLSGAQFALFRDSISLKHAQKSGVSSPHMEFCPDGAFGVDLRNDDAATSFLKANQLEDGKFLCVIPRLRFTPYWKIHNKEKTAEDENRHARSEKMKEHDHAPHRAAIIAVTRQTDLKILICPEDKSQMEVGKEMLYDPLPNDVKKKVVWREKYWLTDEAVSTYVRSAGLFGNEMHSPIMCIGNGVPAIVCRWSEQTTKGTMWRDIGLGDWLFDMDDENEVARVAETVLALAKDPVAARAKAAKALDFVHQRQRETMAVLEKVLGS